MVDINRRHAMKVLGGTAVIGSFPALAVAKAENLGSNEVLESFNSELASTQNVVVPVSSNTELSISLSLESEPLVTLTNHSDKLIVVRHVYPGIVHAGSRTFDINAIFSNKAQSIDAGQSRTFYIESTYSTQAETAFPRHLYGNKPQRVVALTGSDHLGEVVNSSRSFFS